MKGCNHLRVLHVKGEEGLERLEALHELREARAPSGLPVEAVMHHLAQQEGAVLGHMRHHLNGQAPHAAYLVNHALLVRDFWEWHLEHRKMRGI